MTPLRAIRTKCLDCCAGELATVRNCDLCEQCQLWPFRMGKGVRGKGSIIKPIRRYCLWCMKGQPNEIRLCPSAERCALYPYRFGRRQTAMAHLAEKTSRQRGGGTRSPAGLWVGQDRLSEQPKVPVGGTF
jgi:hypothetical protein